MYICDFEEWQGDSQLIENKDWAGLVKLRKHKAEELINDSFSQWEYGEALILNKEYQKAIIFLTKLHEKEPQNINISHLILDALFGLEKSEHNFNWVKRPMVLRLNSKTTDLCKLILKKKSKKISFNSLYSDFLFEPYYLKFNKEDLLLFLSENKTFKISGNLNQILDIKINLI